MKKKRLTELEISKKVYVPPRFEFILVEMECGIAAQSVRAEPGVTDGKTDSVATDWADEDNIEFNSSY